MLKWAPDQIAVFAVSGIPSGLAFDGDSMWVSRLSDGMVDKRQSSDGSLLGSFAAGSPGPLAFDGQNIWVAGQNSTATKLRASDGTVLAAVPSDSSPAAALSTGATCGSRRATVAPSVSCERATGSWSEPFRRV